MKAQGFVSKIQSLEKVHRKTINWEWLIGNIVQIATVASKAPKPSLVRHFTAGYSRLYHQPLTAGFGVFAFFSVLEEKHYNQYQIGSGNSAR
jgi:hypothetical protein